MRTSGLWAGSSERLGVMAGTAKSSGRLGPRLIFGLVLIAAGLWTAAWFYIRGQVSTEIDRSLAQMAAGGLVIECPERSVAGYPFRIEIRCDGPTFEDRVSGLKATARGLRAVALVYQPNLIIVELDAPVTATTRTGAKLAAQWGVMQTSLRFRDGELQRASVSFDTLDGRWSPVGQPEATLAATRLELHGRRDEAVEGLDIAAFVTAGKVTQGGQRLGPETVNLSLDASLVRLPLEPGGGPHFLADWADSDGRVALKSVKAVAGPATLEGRGEIRLETDGMLSGAITLIANNLERLGEAAEPAKAEKPKSANGRPVKDTAGPPEITVTPEMAALAGGFLLFGKPAKDGPPGGRSLEFTLDHGRMKLGATPLGRLPPLFLVPQGS